jgi:ABC-type antimicrobial peptide transport system permease subunit
MWPDRDPLGQRVRTTFMRDSSWITVVGVVEETRMVGITGDNPMVVYIPWEQAGFPGEGHELVLKTEADPAVVFPALGRLVRDLDNRVVVARQIGMDDVLRSSLAQPIQLRFFLTLFGGFALVLGSVGVYGVVAYAVTRRKAEFGIRMALGAAPGRVVRDVVGAGMIPVAVGISLGLLAALALSRVLERFLYGVAPADPVSLGIAGAALLGAGIVAALVPGWRAGRVSPVTALRSE